MYRMLEFGKFIFNMRLPHALLCAYRAVGTTADDVAQRLRFTHALQGDAARRIAGFQRAVDVKTDELGHRARS